MQYDINLFGHPTGSATSVVYLGDLVQAARRYRRSSRAIGGYWLGSFELSQDDLTRPELFEFYNRNIGTLFREKTYGLTTWEGYIIEMRYIQDGVGFMQSLKPKWFQNRTWVIYSDDVGTRAATSKANNTDSQAEFGLLANVYSKAGVSSAGAEALRDTALVTLAWPRSRQYGGAALRTSTRVRPDKLQVYLAGYWFTMNWKYQSSSATGAASALLTSLVGTTEFVTVGRIDTQSDSMHYDAAPIPRRTGNVIEEIVEQGDSSGNTWKGGVYAGRKFIYELAPTTPRLERRGVQLLNAAGNLIPLTTVEPGFLLNNREAPTGWPRPGTASVFDDPRIHYIDEVEFIAARSSRQVDQLRIKLSAEDEGFELLQERVKRGNI